MDKSLSDILADVSSGLENSVKEIIQTLPDLEIKNLLIIRDVADLLIIYSKTKEEHY